MTMPAHNAQAPAARWDYDWLQHLYRFTKRKPWNALIAANLVSPVFLKRDIDPEFSNIRNRLLTDIVFVVAVELLDRLLWKFFVWAMRGLGIQAPSWPPTTRRTFAVLFCLYYRVETPDPNDVVYGVLWDHAFAAFGTWLGFEVLMVVCSLIHMGLRRSQDLDQEMIEQGRYDWLIRLIFG